MKLTSSKALRGYSSAFQSLHDDFLFHYSLDNDKNVTRHTYTRGEFLSLTRKAVTVIRNAGCHKGDRILYCFSANTPEDLAFRLAATMTGVVPVTVNWQVCRLHRQSVAPYQLNGVPFTPKYGGRGFSVRH